METQWIGRGFGKISQSRLEILRTIGVLVHLNRGTAVEGHLGEGVPSQRTMEFRPMFQYCIFFVPSSLCNSLSLM